MNLDVIHPLSGANFSIYWYTNILIPNGVAATVNGTSIPSMASPVILPLGVANSTNTSGAIYLMGVKKFGTTSGTTIGYWENPLSSDPGNAHGTFSIK